MREEDDWTVVAEGVGIRLTDYLLMLAIVEECGSGG